MNYIIKDYYKENFTLREWLKYGVIYPVCIILACGFAGWLINQ
jgi:hypothetical protein